MQKNRTATSDHPRPGIVVDLDHQVVQGILPPQPVAWFTGRAPERAVVAAVRGILAPRNVRVDPAHGEVRPRGGTAIGAPPQAQRPERPPRSRAVAFALVGENACASKHDRDRAAARNEHAVAAPARPRANANERVRAAARAGFHRVGKPEISPKCQLLLALLGPNAHLRAALQPRRGATLSINVRKILIVDDDAELREALVEQLALHEEFQAIAAENGTKGVQAAKAGQIDLVIMDVGLPDIDGREAVRILRNNGFKAPIIMLTGHDSDSDTILGLESGANDYVTKPFRFAVLLARIRAQLRQHEASEDAVFTIGPYTFRPSSKILLNPKGSKVRLTEKETAILRYLYRAGQRPVSRETLLQEVWGYNSGVTTHTLETHIYRLRQKVERDAATPAILITEAGGYKLVP
jgi:DNA-binding response OmpR family regulator